MKNLLYLYRRGEISRQAYLEPRWIFVSYSSAKYSHPIDCDRVLTPWKDMDNLEFPGIFFVPSKIREFLWNYIGTRKTILKIFSLIILLSYCKHIDDKPNAY